MKDIDLLKQLLDNQLKKGVKSGDWEKLDYKIENDTLYINSVKIGFCFNKYGKLEGIFNYKQ